MRNKKLFCSLLMIFVSSTTFAFSDPFYFQPIVSEQAIEQPVNLPHCIEIDKQHNIQSELNNASLILSGIMLSANNSLIFLTTPKQTLLTMRVGQTLGTEYWQLTKIEANSAHFINWGKTNDCNKPKLVQIRI